MSPGGLVAFNFTGGLHSVNLVLNVCTLLQYTHFRVLGDAIGIAFLLHVVLLQFCRWISSQDKWQCNCSRTCTYTQLTTSSNRLLLRRHLGFLSLCYHYMTKPTQPLCLALLDIWCLYLSSRTILALLTARNTFHVLADFICLCMLLSFSTLFSLEISSNLLSLRCRPVFPPRLSPYITRASFGFFHFSNL